MEDNQNVTSEQQEQVQQPANTQEVDIKELEKLAFGVPNQAASYMSNFQQPTSQEQTIPEPEAVQSENVNTEIPQPQSVDINAILKEQLGYDSIDTLKAEIESLKSAQPQSIQYANEEAKKWHQYILEGREEDLYKNLQVKMQMKDLDTMNDEQKLKLFIKLQNPLFDEELIEDEYNQLYRVSEDKFKNEYDELDTLALRKEKLRTQQRIQNDVQKAAEYFQQYKSKIELPPIQTQQQIDEGYESFKASLQKEQELYTNVVVPGLQSVKENDVQMNFSIDDLNNQMKFSMNVAVTPQDLEAAKKESLSIGQYLSKTVYDEKGNFLPNRLVRMILLDQNIDKYAQTLARQAVNEERKRVLNSNTPNNGRIQRDYTQEDDSDLKRLEKFAFMGN